MLVFFAWLIISIFVGLSSQSFAIGFVIFCMGLKISVVSLKLEQLQTQIAILILELQNNNKEEQFLDEI
ncbi:MAG: hypothetical protein JNM93_11875 [Bacteriovoracaceae bacterium]|nr:hypothetical protein [Bacteriovoracaceae bacterium]